MPRFPIKEDTIVALAQQIYIGLRNNMLVWSDPPIRWIWLNIKRLIYNSRRQNMIAARAQAATAYTAQQKALDELITAMKNNLRYAENTVNIDDHKLKLLGWSARRQAATLDPPGQVRRLQIAQRPNGPVKLIWQPPWP